MLSNDKSIIIPNPISLRSINPIYLNSRRNLLQIIKSLNSKQYFSSQTYFTAVLYIDYYFLINNTNRSYKFSDLLLIALCALILSAKYFEIDSHIPDIKKFIYILTHITKHRYTFTLNEVLKGEVFLLKSLQYKLQYHSIYSYTLFYFCHGIIYNNDPFLVKHKLNDSSNENALNKLLEKIYVNARELMDFIIHQSNFIFIGNDCHLGAVAILVKILSVVKGTTTNESADLFNKVYNVDIKGKRFKSILHLIEEQYMKMQVMKEKIRKSKVDSSNSNNSYLKVELQHSEKRKGGNDCNESMLMSMVPELRETTQCEGDKIFMKLLEEDVLFFNTENEDNNGKKHKRALSVSCESSLTKIVFNDSNTNLTSYKYNKESFNVFPNILIDDNNNSNNKEDSISTSENVRKNGKSFTFTYDINEFKNHIAKYKKVCNNKKKNSHNKTTYPSNHNINKYQHNYNNTNMNYLNYNDNNCNNNINDIYRNNCYYYQQLQHNTIIINNNIHINNYSNFNNSNYPYSNYVNMQMPLMNNNNVHKHNNQMIYLNNNFIPNQHNNNSYFTPSLQQQPLYYQNNNFYQQQQQQQPSFQKNINFNHKFNPYSTLNNNNNPYNQPTNYFYNNH